MVENIDNALRHVNAHYFTYKLNLFFRHSLQICFWEILLVLRLWRYVESKVWNEYNVFFFGKKNGTPNLMLTRFIYNCDYNSLRNINIILLVKGDFDLKNIRMRDHRINTVFFSWLTCILHHFILITILGILFKVLKKI